MERIFRPGFQAVAIKEQDADTLIGMKDPKAALVYLCAVRYGEIPSEEIARITGLDLFSVQKAVAGLCDAGLLRVENTGKEEVSVSDVTAAMEDGIFSAMVQETEKQFGYAFSPEDLTGLMKIYKSGKMPPEVILQMVQMYKSDMRRKYGPGRRLKVSGLEKMAAVWAEKGVDTLEKAESFIKRQDNYRTAEGEIKRILQVFGREFVASEKKYVESWLEMGFEPEVIKLAYDRTIERIHEMNYRYMDKILINWHEKGLHTAGEIYAGDSKKPSGKKKGADKSASESSKGPTAGETQRLLKLIENMGKR